MTTFLRCRRAQKLILKAAPPSSFQGRLQIPATGILSVAQLNCVLPALWAFASKAAVAFSRFSAVSLCKLFIHNSFHRIADKLLKRKTVFPPRSKELTAQFRILLRAMLTSCVAQTRVALPPASQHFYQIITSYDQITLMVYISLKRKNMDRKTAFFTKKIIT